MISQKAKVKSLQGPKDPVPLPIIVLWVIFGMVVLLGIFAGVKYRRHLDEERARQSAVSTYEQAHRAGPSKATYKVWGEKR